MNSILDLITDNNGEKFYQFFINMKETEIHYKTDNFSVGLSEIDLNIRNNLCSKYKENNLMDYNRYRGNLHFL